MTHAMLTSEAAAVVATIDPDAYTAAAYTSDEIDMSLYESIMVICMAGVMGATGTIDCKIQDSDASGGTFTDITGKAITQLDQAASGSDKQAIINLRGEEMNTDARYARITMTVATATSDAGVVVIGFGPRYGPASDNDLSSVSEIVA